MKISRSCVAILILLVGLSGCISSLLEVRSPERLENLGETDRIEIDVVKQDKDGIWVPDFTKTITDTKQIDFITETVQKYSDGWESYLPYLPGRLTVDFYEKDELIIPIIVASYSKTSGDDLSYFLSRPAGPARPIQEFEFKELMGLLGIDEDLAYYSEMKISTE